MLHHPPRPFHYLRHGQTAWNLEGRLQGTHDIPLNETGRGQAHTAAEALRDVRIDRIISSPMARAAETADIVAASKGLTPTRDPRLREHFFGSYEGLTLAEIRDKHGSGDGTSIWTITSPDAERFEDALARTLAAIHDGLNGHEEAVLFVAHGAIFTLLSDHLFGHRIHSANAAPYLLEQDGDIWRATEV